MAEALKPWYAVATPHEDIRKGKLDEAVFAANIWAVVQGTAPDIYKESDEFFGKTFLTDGLSAILKRVAGALNGSADSGDRIISLQTSFGGGKTHTLLALWHLAKHAKKLEKSSMGDSLKKILGGKFPEKVKGIAVFTNATCDVTQGRTTPEGIHTRTLWGEIACQLGGKKLYDKVKANDETQRVPQGIFVDVLREAAPCLILLDEIADYCVGAAAVSVGDTTLADQTISFIQQLTEAVQQVPGVMLVATLPASKYEVAQSEKGQEAFVALEKRYQRYGADLKLVSDEEIFQVVRTRLFESVVPADDPDYPKKLSQAYVNMYKQHSGEVPDETTKGTYRELIEKSFPFHPSLIDTLYKRWGSHPDFQRTRGVLRLLASIVSDLWQKKGGNTRTQHLIQPCHISWSIDALQAALTRYWGIAYQSVCAEDVIGARANSGAFDEERGGDYQTEGIGQGLVAAILLGSFGGQGQKAGMNSKEIKLSCSRYGLNWNYTDGALLELEERCFFLYSTSAGSLGKRYWFGTKPTLNKLIVQYRQQTGSENFDNEILEALRSQIQQNAGGASWRVIVNPEADLPEQKSLVLLVIHPSTAWNGDKDSQARVKNYALQLSSKCGGKERLYRNTLLFLAPTQKGLGKLRNAFRERAALAGVQKDYSTQLDDDQKAELKKKIEIAEKALIETMGPAYTIAVKVTGQDVETATLSDARPNFGDHLGYLWTTLVEDEEWILRRVGSVTLQKTGIVPESGGMRIKDAIDVFLRYTDKPMIASKDAVVQGLAQACKDGVLGIARGVNLTNIQSRSCREQVFIDPNEDGLWIIPPFAPEEGKGEVPGTGAEGAAGTTTTDTSEAGASTTETAETGKAAIHSLVIKGHVPLDSWGDIFRCFVNPAARMQLKKLNLGIQFEIEPSSEHPIDKNDPAFKAMQEAAKQLGLKIEIKE